MILPLLSKCINDLEIRTFYWSETFTIKDQKTYITTLKNSSIARNSLLRKVKLFNLHGLWISILSYETFTYAGILWIFLLNQAFFLLENCKFSCQKSININNKILMKYKSRTSLSTIINHHDLKKSFMT